MLLNLFRTRDERIRHKFTKAFRQQYRKEHTVTFAIKSLVDGDSPYTVIENLVQTIQGMKDKQRVAVQKAPGKQPKMAAKSSSSESTGKTTKGKRGRKKGQQNNQVVELLKKEKRVMLSSEILAKLYPHVLTLSGDTKVQLARNLSVMLSTLKKNGVLDTIPYSSGSKLLKYGLAEFFQKGGEVNPEYR